MSNDNVSKACGWPWCDCGGKPCDTLLAARAKDQAPTDKRYFDLLELAEKTWQRCYSNEAAEWKPCADFDGLLDQLDCMVAGLSHRGERG